MRPIGINGDTIFQSYDEYLLLVMKRLFENPELAFYPTECCLSQWSFAPEPEEGDSLGLFDKDISTKHRLMRIQLQHNLTKIVDDFRLIQPNERQEWYEALMGSKFKGAMIALMFILLKNIREVEIQSSYFGDISGYIWTVVERIAINHRLKGATLCSEELPLSNLQAITYRAIGDHDEENIRALIPFAMLPSVRVLNGRMITSRGYITRQGVYSVWPLDYPIRTSGVTKIKLSSSRCSPKALESLIAGIASLEEFSYHHSSNSDDILYEPGEIAKVLVKYTSSSLKKLTLCAPQEFFDDEEIELQRQYGGSLQQLVALEKIVADDKLFERRWLRDGCSIPFVAMKPLVDALPTSTISVTLLQTMRAKRARNLFRDMAELKEERLPKLQKLSYYDIRSRNHGTPIRGSIKHSLEELGIVISTTRPRYYDRYDMYECPTEH